MAERNLVLILPLGDVRVGLPATDVVEVVPMALLQPLPDAPSAVVGSLDLRGERLPVVDLRTVLGVHAEQPGLAASIAVVRVDGRAVGLLAGDGTPEVIEIDAVRAATPLESRGRVVGIGQGDEDVLVIDPDTVVATAMGAMT